MHTQVLKGIYEIQNIAIRRHIIAKTLIHAHLFCIFFVTFINFLSLCNDDIGLSIKVFYDLKGGKESTLIVLSKLLF